MNARSRCLPMIQNQTTMRDWLSYFNTKFFIVFINYTSKYTPQHRLIWDFFVIICNTSFWIEKITILQFGKNIWHFLTNIALIASTRTKRISIFNHTLPVLSQLISIQTVKIIIIILMVVKIKHRKMLSFFTKKSIALRSDTNQSRIMTTD